MCRYGISEGTSDSVSEKRSQEAVSPLGPYRVLDLTDEKGVLCAKILADLGAEVIVIEKPSGSPMRAIGPFFRDSVHPERSLHWFHFNTSKKSVTLDIEKVEGKQLFKRLVQTADFVIECFAPGYLQKLGLGYDVLSNINPGLILTSISGFGQTGPYSAYKASDLIGTAMGGLAYLSGYSDRAPLRFWGSQAYNQVNLQACLGTLIAHWHRVKTGEGQHVDVSMQESLCLTIIPSLHDWYLNRDIRTRGGQYTKYPYGLIRRIYPCKDGYVALICLEVAARFLPRVAAWMASKGEAGDLTDEKWKERGIGPGPGQLSAMEILHVEELIGDFLLKRDKTELYEDGQKWGVTIAPVNSPGDLLQDPQLLHRGFFVEVEHPELETALTYPAPPFKFSSCVSKIWRRAPLLGEHNEEIYVHELGLSRADACLLKNAGVI